MANTVKIPMKSNKSVKTVNKLRPDATLEFSIEQNKEYGYKENKIANWTKTGANVIFEDLVRTKALSDFYPASPKKADPDGYYQGSIIYESKQNGLALLRLHNNVQDQNFGIIRSTIPNDDCMIYERIEGNEFKVYIFNGQREKERFILRKYLAS